MKITRLAFLAIALPIAASAQAPAGGSPANPIATVFKNRTLGQQRVLAQAFDSIPASLFNYKPTAPQLSIGYIAQHLASDNYFFCNHFGDAKGTPDPMDASTPDSVKAKWPKDQLVAKLKASFAFCETALNQLTDASLAEQITITFGGNSRQAPRASTALGHVADMADHYSQIANYMRLNNMIPPTALPRPRPGN